MVRAEAGMALYEVTGEVHIPGLRLLSPDAAAYAGIRLRSERILFDAAAGVGWRHFSGSTRSDGVDRDVSSHAADLRLALGLHTPIGRTRSLGAELMVAKVLIEQTIATLSFTYGWQGE